jgi:hypothetical protein
MSKKMRIPRARRRALALGLALLPCASLPARARADTASEQAPTAQTALDEFPKRLAINVVANESLLSTFGQRVSSWFTDDTQVVVTVTSEVDLDQMLAADTSEVRAWIVPLSAERALLTFSCVTPHSAARHLVREVRLRNGFDELGQERLAALVHAAFIALREGTDGFERASAERALGAVGIVPGGRATLVELTPAAREQRPAAAADSRQQPIARAAGTRSEFLLGVGYGAKLRGPGEGIGHGPSFALGVQLPTTPIAIDLLLSGQFLFRSQFAAERFDASAQVSALRAHVGIEPALGSELWGQALLGAGVDIAQVHSSSTKGPSSDSVHTSVRESGTQWRAVSELDLGVLRRWQPLDFGVYAQFTVLLEDVHYSVNTDRGEQRLLTPWPVQVGLLLQGRFRSAL